MQVQIEENIKRHISPKKTSFEYIALEALFALITFFYSKSKLNVRQKGLVIVEWNDEVSAWMELIAFVLAESRTVKFKNERDTW